MSIYKDTLCSNFRSHGLHNPGLNMDTHAVSEQAMMTASKFWRMTGTLELCLHIYATRLQTSAMKFIPPGDVISATFLLEELL